MNRNEAKNILLPYRHGTADANDPQIAGALALAERDQELKDWLINHCARQFVVRENLRQIRAPAGLKEQIISERTVQEKVTIWRPQFALAALAVLVLLTALVPFWFLHRNHDDTLDVYQNRMASVALRGYAMDLVTNNPEQIRAYLAQHQAPSDFNLPEKLKQASLVGCAVEGWQGVKVSMICFHTDRPLVSSERSDLWLFVVDSASVRGVPDVDLTQFSKVNQLITATWSKGGKLFLLGIDGDEQTLRQYL